MAKGTGSFKLQRRHFEALARAVVRSTNGQGPTVCNVDLLRQRLNGVVLPGAARGMLDEMLADVRRNEGGDAWTADVVEAVSMVCIEGNQHFDSKRFEEAVADPSNYRFRSDENYER